MAADQHLCVSLGGVGGGGQVLGYPVGEGGGGAVPTLADVDGVQVPALSRVLLAQEDVDPHIGAGDHLGDGDGGVCDGAGVGGGGAVGVEAEGAVVPPSAWPESYWSRPEGPGAGWRRHSSPHQPLPQVLRPEVA